MLTRLAEVAITLANMSTDGTAEVFQHVHMQGPRFQGGALPLSATDDLQRFEKLVEKVARALFLRDHPDRARVSSATLGVEGFDLAITRLSKGSVGVDLSVRRSGATLSVGEDYAERARQLIEGAFAGLADEGKLPEEFPGELVSDFALMGSSLKQGESLTWAKTRRFAKRSRAVLTPSTTEPIRVLVPPDRPTEELLNAYVVGVCSDPLEFNYKFDGGGQTRRGSFTRPEVFHSLREVCGFANRTPLVALSVLRTPDSPRKVVDVLNVEALLPSEWAARLEALAALERGWLDGQGLPISKDAIQTAESLLFKILDAQLPRPGVFPTREGGVQMEWASGPIELEVVVSNGGFIRVFLEDEDEDGYAGSVGLVFTRVQEALRVSAIS
jgi:hypothetical protein